MEAFSKNGRANFPSRWFSLAELIVVIAILAVLATIGFVSLSQYRSSALDARSASNVRSVLTAISAESSISESSPRAFVKHDADYALSGSSVVVFDGIPSILIPWPFGAPGTNYSAGNPDYAKLKLDPERFKVSFLRQGSKVLAAAESLFSEASADVADPDYVLVGAADVMNGSDGKMRQMRFVQTAGILSTTEAFVTGDYPSWMEGSIGWLIRDPKDPSWTWALVDGKETGGPAGCEASEISWFALPELASSESATIEKTTDHGILRTVASCSFWNASVSEAIAICDSWYVPAESPGWRVCVADVCGGTVPSHATSNASAQSVVGIWHHSESANLCTFSCDAWFSWDGTSCKASCEIPLTRQHSWLEYAFSEIAVLKHGESRTMTGTHSFWTAPQNGSLTERFEFACNDGAVTVAATEWSASCQTNYGWNGSRSAPSCIADVRMSDCWSSVPVNGTASTASEYVQTWDGIAGQWLPDLSWSVGAGTCWYSCDSNYVPSGGACVWASRTATCTWLPSNALWNSVSSIIQTWNGNAWSPSSSGTFNSVASAAECRYKCAQNYTWNGVVCQADTRTFECAAKPSSWTDWNGVSSYVQTWNGSAWLPADSNTSYSTSASSTECRYKCASGYWWDSASSSCKASVWGSCGTATPPSYAYPSSNHCATGTKTDSDTAGSDGAFDWTCSWQYGWTAASCSSPKKTDGVCWSSNGLTLASAPSSNLCSAWTASAITWSGPWNWTCSWANSGNSASCSASRTSYAVTWDGNGWTWHTPATQNVYHGAAIWTLPSSPTKAGHTFAGWYSAASGGVQVTSATTVSATVTYYAQWTVNTYAVSGSFWTNGAGATVTWCWKSVVADASGAFSFGFVAYGTACANVAASRTNYACSTTTNWPASVAGTVTGVSGSCSPNTQSASCGWSIPANAAASTSTTYVQTWNGSAWAPVSSWTNGGASCGFACNANYSWNGSSCVQTSFGFTYAITAQTANFNLKNQAIAAGWNQTLPLNANVTINPGVVVYWSSPSTAAFTVGALPAWSSVGITNNGYVYWAGWAGGGWNGVAWSNGGDAISFAGAVSVTVNNANGYVFGGGGGGGGGAIRTNTNVLAGGGGGGGGQWYVGGGGGGGGAAYAWAQYPTGAAGGAGNSSSPWAGGAGWNSWYYPNQWAGWYCIAWTGGAGWAWWAAGGAGGIGSGGYCPNYTPWNGGAGGYSVRKNGATVTWTGGNDASRVKWAAN